MWAIYIGFIWGYWRLRFIWRSILKKIKTTQKTSIQQQLSSGYLFKIIVDLKKQDLVKARNLVQKHNNKQQAKKHKATLVKRNNENKRKKKCQEKNMLLKR